MQRQLGKQKSKWDCTKEGEGHNREFPTLESITAGLDRQRKYQAEALKTQFERDTDAACNHAQLRGAYIKDYRTWREDTVEEHRLNQINVKRLLKALGFVKHDDRFHTVSKDYAMDTALRQAYLIGDRVSVKAAGWISEALASPDCVLELLHLSDNFEPGEGAARAFFQGLGGNRSLTTLAVNANSIDDSTVASPLADALGANATLLTLNLTNNAIGDAGAATLGAVLAHNQTLSELNLGNNDIGDAGAASLAEALIAQSQQLILTGGECRASTCEDAEEKGADCAFAPEADGKVWSSRGILPHWVEYDLGKGKKMPCTGYSFRGHRVYDRITSDGPISYRFQGSNDRHTWEDLHSVMLGPEFQGMDDLRSNECWEEGAPACSLTERQYRWFRLYVSDVPGRSRRDKPTAVRDLQVWATGLGCGALKRLDVSDNRIGDAGGRMLRKCVSRSIMELEAGHNDGMSEDVEASVADAVRASLALQERDRELSDYQLAWQEEQQRQEALAADKAARAEERQLQAQLQALPLPDGWVEMLDEGSGQPYYYNEGTGETSWEHPAAAVAGLVQDSGEANESEYKYG